MKECNLKGVYHEKIEIRQLEMNANMKSVRMEEWKQKKCNREGLQNGKTATWQECKHVKSLCATMQTVKNAT